jgi:amidase
MTLPVPPLSAAGAKGTAFVPHDLLATIPGASGGPLAGLTAAVKDAFDIAGERTGAGSPEWLAAGEVATTTADAVRQVIDAGASVVGKTICDEFLYSISGANAHYGTPVNPRAPDRLPGGSSSGSAAATAAGACDFALGTDTGGSVRVPAAFCGVFGIRTSPGRVAMRGVVPMAPSFDSVGWFAPSAGMLRRVGSALLGAGGVAAPVDRLVVAVDLLAAADPEVQSAVRRFVARLHGELLRIDESVVAPDGTSGWSECFRVIQGFETWQTFGAWISAHAPRLGPGIDERMRYAATVTDIDAETARAHRAAIRARLIQVVPPGTVVLMPTVPCFAPRLDADHEQLQQFRARTMGFTCVAGLGGLPEVSIPVGLADGAPAAVSMLGWPGGDEVLLDLAARLAVHCGP